MSFTSVAELEPAVRSGVETYRGFEETPRVSRARGLILEVSFQGRSRTLARPVAVVFGREGESWFAENEELNLFGVGESAKVAKENFRQHLEHFLEHYHGLALDRVAGEGLRLKRLYEGLLASDAA